MLHHSPKRPNIDEHAKLDLALGKSIGLSCSCLFSAAILCSKLGKPFSTSSIIPLRTLVASQPRLSSWMKMDANGTNKNQKSVTIFGSFSPIFSPTILPHDLQVIEPFQTTGSCHASLACWHCLADCLGSFS